MKPLNALILLFIFAGLAGCGPDSPSVDANGVFETTEVVVSAEASGRILSLGVTEGARLHQGEIVGVIDSIQIYLQREQILASIQAARSRVVDVRAQIASLDEQLETAENERQRFENLVEVNAINRKQLDDINATIRVLRAQRGTQVTNLNQQNRTISEEIASMEFMADRLADQLKKAVVRSPISGVVLADYAKTGELATFGRPLFKVGDTEFMILRAYITSDQLSKVKLGQAVEVVADSGRDGSREYEGVVSWISDKSEFTPKTVQTRDERANLVYAVKITVPNDGYLKIGMYGGVRF